MTSAEHDLPLFEGRGPHVAHRESFGESILVREASSASASGATRELARSSESRDEPARAITRPTAITYLAQVAAHPSNLLFLIAVLFTSLILWSVAALVAGAALEVLILAIVPRVRFFRRRIDLALDELARAVLVKEREALIREMGEGHRLELCKIEGLVSRAGDNVRKRDGDRRALAQALSLGRLQTSYIRLAIAHRACEEALSLTSPKALEGTIQLLEGAERSAPEHLRRLLQRRLSVARRRVACWAKTRESLDALSHQLATITELCHLVLEESIGPGEISPLDEIDGCVEELEHREVALREVAELSGLAGLAHLGSVDRQHEERRRVVEAEPLPAGVRHGEAPGSLVADLGHDGAEEGRLGELDGDEGALVAGRRGHGPVRLAPSRVGDEGDLIHARREVRAAVERVDPVRIAEADAPEELLDATGLCAGLADDRLRLRR